VAVDDGVLAKDLARADERRVFLRDEGRGGEDDAGEREQRDEPSREGPRRAWVHAIRLL
jgi:hypothetical protein